MDDVEKEVNSIHEKVFNGELVTNKKTKSQTPFPLENANCSISPPANSQDQLTQAARANKKPTAFRKITPVGNTLIFGDSNTKGLEKSRMAMMGIGSISGATFDSVISYLQSDPTPDESINRIISHLVQTTSTQTPLKHRQINWLDWPKRHRPSSRVRRLRFAKSRLKSTLLRILARKSVKSTRKLNRWMQILLMLKPQTRACSRVTANTTNISEVWLFWLGQLNDGRKKMGTSPLRYDKEQNENQKTDEGSKQTIGHAEIRTSSQPIYRSNYCIYSWLSFNAVNEHSNESEHHLVVSLNL